MPIDQYSYFLFRDFLVLEWNIGAFLPVANPREGLERVKI